MAGVVGVIWVSREAEYFCGRDWTGQISLKLLEKLAHWRADGRFTAPPPPSNPSLAPKHLLLIRLLPSHRRICGLEAERAWAHADGSADTGRQIAGSDRAPPTGYRPGCRQ